VESAEGNPVDMVGSATLTFTATEDHELPATVKVFGAEHTWDKSTGTLVLTNPSGTIEVYIGYAEKYEITSDSLIAIARAIREKAGMVESLDVDSMISTIKNM
jgi:hypothetical protein